MRCSIDTDAFVVLHAVTDQKQVFNRQLHHKGGDIIVIKSSGKTPISLFISLVAVA